MAMKRVIICIVICISNHPFLAGAFFLFLLHGFFPSAIFSWLVSATPVIICTILLLGIILSYGEQNIAEIEREERKKPEEIASLVADVVSNDLVIKRDESLALGDNVDRRREISATSSVGEAALDAPNSSVARDKKEIENEKELNKGDEVSNRRFAVKRGISVRRLGRVVSNIEEYGGEVPTKDCEGNEAPKVESNHNESKNSSDSKSESETGSKSESESDQCERSSPDTFMADVMPMLDEIHPLIDSEPPQMTRKSVNDFYAASQTSSQNQESNDGDDDNGAIAEEDAGNQEEDDEEDEEDDAQEEEEKDDGSDGMVKWTADDQKNLMDLGTSELERNQRLENLIAKRRARKLQRAETEKNLIDFDSNDPAPIVEELSRLLVNIMPISATRRNPFDLPVEPDIPGSAPSILLPGRNPFDLPYGQEDDNSSAVQESTRLPEPLAAQQREMLFCRHESFTVGPSFFRDGSATRHPSRLKPYFVAERTNSEEPGLGTLARQLNEKGSSKASSSSKSESSSSIGEGEDSRQGLEQEHPLDGAFGSPAYCNDEHVEREGQSSKEGDAVDDEQEHSGVIVGGDEGVDLNTSNEIEDETASEEEEEETEEEVRHELEPKSEMIEEKYDASGSSTSSEADEECLNMKCSEETAANLERTKKSLKGFNDSAPAILANDDQAVEPVYDSSPSAIEKSHANALELDETLFNGGKGGFNSATSFSYDMQGETSEVDTTPRPVDKNDLSGDEGSISSNGSVRKGLEPGSGGCWVASSNLCCVEANESQSREVTEVRELDVFQFGYPGLNEDFSTPLACIMPPSPASRFAHQFSLSSMRTHSSEYSSMEEDVNLPSDGNGDEMTNDSIFSDRDKLVIYHDPASSALGQKEQIKEPADQAFL